jgi:hypothetical protein
MNTKGTIIVCQFLLSDIIMITEQKVKQKKEARRESTIRNSDTLI